MRELLQLEETRFSTLLGADKGINPVLVQGGLHTREDEGDRAKLRSLNLHDTAIRKVYYGICTRAVRPVRLLTRAAMKANQGCAGSSESFQAGIQRRF